MCMLTFFPQGVQPDINNLRNGTYCNDDGHGYAIVVPEEKKLIVSKSMDAESLLEEFGQIRAKHPEGPALFHSRFATHGVLNVDNCHPFYVGNDNLTVIGHNGILPKSAQPGQDDERSDTKKFAETLYPTGRYGSIRSKGGRKQLFNYIGGFNKLVFLTVNPAYSDNSYIINEKAGIWVNGIWYSNDGFKGYTSRIVYVSKRAHSLQCQSCYSFGTIDQYTEICKFCHMCAGCDKYASECECYQPEKLDNPVEYCFCINSYVCGAHTRNPSAQLTPWNYDKADKTDLPDDWCPCTKNWKCLRHRPEGAESGFSGFTFGKSGKSDNEVLEDKVIETTGKRVEDMTEAEWQAFLANDLKTDKESELPICEDCDKDVDGCTCLVPENSDVTVTK